MFTLVRGGPSLPNGVCEFLITSALDLEDLPNNIRPGSIAYTADRSLRYTLDNDGVWRAEISGDNRIASAIESIAGTMKVANRVVPLGLSDFASGNVVDEIGIPIYVSDVSDYAAYSLTDTGWYVFARIFAPEGVTVTVSLDVEGAAGYTASLSDDHIDVAVRFEVAAQSQKVVVDWGETTDTFIFRANDLAIRNLDYRTTFYVYDAADYVTWSYKFAEGTSIAEGKQYFTKSGETYSPLEAEAGDPIPAYYEQVISYALTSDQTFQDGKTYYTRDEATYTAAEVTTGEAVTADTYYELDDGVYSLTEDTTFQDGKTYYTRDPYEYIAAEVTTGEAVTADTYYVEVISYVQTTDETFQNGKTYYEFHSVRYDEAEVEVGEAVTANTYYEFHAVVYALTADTTFQEGKTYYTYDGSDYTAAEVEVGAAVTAETYYEKSENVYSLTADETFQDGKTYYTKTVNVYSEATVTEGAAVPAYYVHSKAVFEGMSRNVSYKLNETIDCPLEIILPEIDENGYGAWFELQLRYDGSYSCTLTLPEGVTAGTTTTQAQTAGVNVIDLHYVSVNGAKTWQLINTHTNLS